MNHWEIWHRSAAVKRGWQSASRQSQEQDYTETKGTAVMLRTTSS